MRHGRWYPTLTELPDGRVVIVAGLDEEPLGVGDNNNTDIEVFTPSPNLDGVGSIQLVKEGQGFGLYPHVFVNTQGKLVVVGPDEEDSRIIDPTNWSVTPTQLLPSYGPQGGRREWGSAVMLPSGPDGPSTIMMIGGSDAEDDHYDNPDQTNTTLLVNMANGGITSGPSNIRKRSHVNTTILPDGSLFTNGGGAGSIAGDQYAGPVFTAELLNPGASSWIETDPQQAARTYHSTSLLLPDGRVATMGDDRTENSQNRALRRVEYYKPPYLFKGRAAHDHVGPGRRALRRGDGDRDAQCDREGRDHQAGLHHPRPRHQPAVAVTELRRGARRHQRDDALQRERRPARLLPALPAGRRGGSVGGEDHPSRHGRAARRRGSAGGPARPRRRRGRVPGAEDQQAEGHGDVQEGLRDGEA